jgi:hypothetical protein
MTTEALIQKLKANNGYALVKSRRSTTAIVREDAAMLVKAGLAEYQPGHLAQVQKSYNFGRVRKIVTKFEPGICILK